MDWENLKTFLAIARHGTLSGAARALGVTQTTMGRRLDALHVRSGAKLLTRTPAGFVLTATGEAALAHAEKMEEEALAIERTILGGDVRLEGTVRVTTVEALGAYILAPGLASFAQRYPGITVSLDTSTRMVSLARREADIALRVASFDNHDVVVRKAGTMAYGFYASREYLARHGDPGAGSASPHTVVTVEEDLLHMPEAQWLAKLAPKAGVVFRSNNREAQAQACAAGVGFACLPRYLADPLPGLVLLKIEPSPPARELFLGLHKDTRHTPRIRAVADHIAAILDAAKARLSPS